MAQDEEVGAETGGMKKFCLIAIPDNMEHWTEKPEIILSGQIWSVFIIDLTVVTHLCELKPSYWLEYLDFFYKNDLSEDEALRERVEDHIRLGQSQYEPSTYWHCDNIDTKMREGIKDRFGATVYGDTFMWFKEFEDMEQARDYWGGNPPFPPLNL